MYEDGQIVLDRAASLPQRLHRKRFTSGVGLLLKLTSNKFDAIVEMGKARPIGSTRYLNIRPEHRSLEIGWTWLGTDCQ